MKKFLITFLSVIISFSMNRTVAAQGNGTCIAKEVQETCVKYGEEYAENGNCKGLMQISDNWHTERMENLGVTDIFDIDGNIHVGTDYLAELAEKYGDIGTVLMVYHGEKNAANKTEISDYAFGILERSAELERMHGK